MMFFLFILLIFGLYTEAKRSSTCDKFYSLKNDVWLYGEVPLIAFPTQLLAVYSFIPLAFHLETSLVLAPFRVHEVFTINSTSHEWKLTEIPFSSLFDLNYFINYWTGRSLTITTWDTYQSCFDQSYFRPTSYISNSGKHIHYLRNVTRIPGYFPFNRERLFSQFLPFSNLSTTTNNFHFPFDNHEFIKVVGNYALAAMYSYWDDLPRLQSVYESLRPSSSILTYTNFLLSHLPHKFIAVNLRLDDAAISSVSSNSNSSATSSSSSSSNNDADHHLHRSMEKLLQYVQQHPCVQQYGTSFPIYLSTNVKPYNKLDRKRLKRLLEEIHDKGLTNFVTRKSLIDSLKVNKTSSSHHKHASKSHEATSFHETEAIVSPEQLQFIDILVSKRAVCVIPSLAPSLASYLIMRFKALDKGVVEKYEDITPEKYGNLIYYRDWGL